MSRYVLAGASFYILHNWNYPLSVYLGLEHPRRGHFSSYGGLEYRHVLDLMVKPTMPFYSYQYITHMFVHETYEDARRAVLDTAISCYPIYKVFGPCGLLLPYIGGGYTAAILTSYEPSCYKIYGNHAVLQFIHSFNVVLFCQYTYLVDFSRWSIGSSTDSLRGGSQRFPLLSYAIAYLSLWQSSQSSLKEKARHEKQGLILGGVLGLAAPYLKRLFR